MGDLLVPPAWGRTSPSPRSDSTREADPLQSTDTTASARFGERQHDRVPMGEIGAAARVKVDELHLQPVTIPARTRERSPTNAIAIVLAVAFIIWCSLAVQQLCTC